jgi:hypothetical protein
VRAIGVATVGLAIGIVVVAVCAVLSAGHTVGRGHAVLVVAVDVPVAVVVRAVGTGLGDGRAGRGLRAIGIRAVDISVAVVVTAVFAILSVAEANGGAGAVIVVAVGVAVGIVVLAVGAILEVFEAHHGQVTSGILAVGLAVSVVVYEVVAMLGLTWPCQRAIGVRTVDGAIEVVVLSVVAACFDGKRVRLVATPGNQKTDGRGEQYESRNDSVHEVIPSTRPRVLEKSRPCALFAIFPTTM